jgi:hypothetical protein
LIADLLMPFQIISICSFFLQIDAFRSCCRFTLADYAAAAITPMPLRRFRFRQLLLLIRCFTR